MPLSHFEQKTGYRNINEALRDLETQLARCGITSDLLTRDSEWLESRAKRQRKEFVGLYHLGPAMMFVEAMGSLAAAHAVIEELERIRNLPQ